MFIGVTACHKPTTRKVPTFLLLTNQSDNMFGTVHLFVCTQKKGTETVPLGCYCYKFGKVSHRICAKKNGPLSLTHFCHPLRDKLSAEDCSFTICAISIIFRIISRPWHLGSGYTWYLGIWQNILPQNPYTRINLMSCIIFLSGFPVVKKNPRNIMYKFCKLQKERDGPIIVLQHNVHANRFKCNTLCWVLKIKKICCAGKFSVGTKLNMLI